MRRFVLDAGQTKTFHLDIPDLDRLSSFRDAQEKAQRIVGSIGCRIGAISDAFKN